jgi:hypothetical protein
MEVVLSYFEKREILESVGLVNLKVKTNGCHAGK